MDERQLDEQDKRRTNVEKLLGPVKSASAAPSYIVRLGDTLRSIATKHPALNDVKLWKLLAEKNGLSAACDAKGLPKAKLMRGTKLLLPSAKEIAEFRTGRKPLVVAPDLSAKTSSEPVSKECGGCHRLTTLSATVCPACGFSFVKADLVVSPDGDTVFTDRAPKNAASTTSNVSQNLGPETLVDRSRLPAPRLQSDDSTSLLNVPDVQTSVSFNTSNERLTAPQSQKPTTAEVELERNVQDLSDNCRLVRTVVERNGVQIVRAQLDGKKGDFWNVILFYELSEDGSIRQETLPTGGVLKIEIDLPMSLALDMVENDLSSNWQTYCKKFFAGKRLSA
jgi:hypothetical protein